MPPLLWGIFVGIFFHRFGKALNKINPFFPQHLLLDLFVETILFSSSSFTLNFFFSLKGKIFIIFVNSKWKCNNSQNTMSYIIRKFFFSSTLTHVSRTFNRLYRIVGFMWYFGNSFFSYLDLTTFLTYLILYKISGKKYQWFYLIVI